MVFPVFFSLFPVRSKQKQIGQGCHCQALPSLPGRPCFAISVFCIKVSISRNTWCTNLSCCPLLLHIQNCYFHFWSQKKKLLFGSIQKICFRESWIWQNLWQFQIHFMHIILKCKRHLDDGGLVTHFLCWSKPKMTNNPFLCSSVLRIWSTLTCIGEFPPCVNHLPQIINFSLVNAWMPLLSETI